MCGRYHVDEQIAKKIEDVAIKIAGKQHTLPTRKFVLQAHDVHPTEEAPVLLVTGDEICVQLQRWGFPGIQGKNVIFNARCETVLDKSMFLESVKRRRAVIPATWFYEWNKRKEKNTFLRMDQQVMFMAGFYENFQGEDRFVILTTEANASMQPVHDRMPLILEEKEISDWIFNAHRAEEILMKVPCLLERRCEYEQLSFL